MKKVYKVLIIMIMVLGIIGCFMQFANAANTTNTTSANQTTEQTTKADNNKGIGLISAALAVGLACVGAGIAVALVASSAVGAISENPELLGKTIIFAGLAEGIAIYGLIISIMILNKI